VAASLVVSTAGAGYPQRWAGSRSDTIMIETATFVSGLVLGAMLLVVAAFVYASRNVFGFGGTLFLVFGTILVGLSLWRSVELTVDPDGGLIAIFKQEIGAEAAELNGKILDLERQIAKAISKLETISARSENSPSSMATKTPDEVDADFERNSNYKVLVFFKNHQQEAARRMENVLLSHGFRSSATETTLSQALRQFQTNTAWVIYTEDGKPIVDDVISVLRGLDLDVTFVKQPKASKLRRGDVQVLLF
jgi:hypothetical protein